MSAGYAFVPLPDRVSIRHRPAAVHDRRVDGALSGTLSVTFITEQPVHVGSGFKGLDDRRVVRRAALVQGLPGVPGASFKGVLRARYEAITRSCVPGGIKERWKVRSQTYNLDKAEARLTDGARTHVVFRSAEVFPDLCPACALFGRMSFRSRVRVADFACMGSERRSEIATMPKQFGPNVHHVGRFRPVAGAEALARGPALEVYELYGRKFAVGRGPTSDDGAKEHVEVVPRGVRLRGDIHIINVLPEELGGLLIATGVHPSPGALKVGGGKAQGFGRVRPVSMGYRLYDATGRDVEADEQAWSDAFEQNSEDRFALGEQTLLEIHQGDC